MERVHHHHRHASAASTSSATSSAPRRRFASPMSLPYNLSDSEEVEERLGKAAPAEARAETTGEVSELCAVCAQQASDLQALTNLLAERTFAEQVVQRMESESTEYGTFLHELLQLAAPTATRHRLLARGDVNAEQARAKSAEKKDNNNTNDDNALPASSLPVMMNRVREAVLMQQQRLRELELAAEERAAATEAAARERDCLTQHLSGNTHSSDGEGRKVQESAIDTLHTQLDELTRQRDEMTGRLQRVQDELEQQKRTAGQAERELRLRSMEVAELRQLLSKKTEDELKRAQQQQTSTNASSPSSSSSPLSSARSLVRTRHSRVFTGAAYALLYRRKPDVLRDALLRAACTALQLPYGFLSLLSVHAAAHSLAAEFDVRHDAARLPAEAVDLRLLECGFVEVAGLAAEAAAECLAECKAELREARAEAEALHARLQTTQAALDEHRSERAANDEEVRQALEETAETIATLHEAVRSTGAELTSAQAALAEAQASATRSASVAQHEAEALRQSLQESRAQAKTTSVRCTMAEKAKARLEEALRAAEAAAATQTAALQHAVQSKEEELVQLRQAQSAAAERDALQARLAELGQQLKTSQAGLVRANTATEAEARQRRALEDKLCLVAEEKAAVTRQCAELEIDMQDFAKIQASLQDDLGAARVALRASEQDKQALREQLALLQQQEARQDEQADDTTTTTATTGAGHGSNNAHTHKKAEEDEESSLAEMSMVLVNLVVTLRYCLRCLRLSTSQIPSSLHASAAHNNDNNNNNNNSNYSEGTQSFVSAEHVLRIASEAYELVRHLKHALNRPGAETTQREVAAATPSELPSAAPAALPISASGADKTTSAAMHSKPPRTTATTTAIAAAHSTEETRQGSSNKQQQQPLPSSSISSSRSLPASQVRHGSGSTNTISSSSNNTRQVYKRSAGAAGHATQGTRGFARSASASAAFPDAEHRRREDKTRTEASSVAAAAGTPMHGFVRLPSTPTTGTLRRPLLGSEGRSALSNVPLYGGSAAAAAAMERRRSSGGGNGESATSSSAGTSRLVPPPTPTNVFRRSYTATSSGTTAATTTLTRTPSGTRCPL